MDKPAALEALEDADQALWLLGQLDQGLHPDFMHYAYLALESYVCDPKARLPKLKSPPSLEECERISLSLTTLEATARKEKYFTAARILQSWAAAFRVGIYTYKVKIGARAAGARAI